MPFSTLCVVLLSRTENNGAPGGGTGFSGQWNGRFGIEEDAERPRGHSHAERRERVSSMNLKLTHHPISSILARYARGRVQRRYRLFISIRWHDLFPVGRAEGLG